MKKGFASWALVGILIITVVFLGACSGKASVAPASSTRSPAVASPAAAVATNSNLVSTGQPPLIPHSITLRYECLLCHGEPGETEVPYGPNHVGRTQDICRNCHKLPAEVGR